MSTVQTLIDDASLLQDPDRVSGPALADALIRAIANPSSTLAISDRQLAAADRVADRLTSADGLASNGGLVPVTVVNTIGAGGLISLAARFSAPSGALPHLALRAVRSALRDLDDPTGNAARIVSAAAELDEEVEVYVELPDAWGWERAAEVVEAAGLYAGLTAGAGSALALTRRMSALVELDLGFALDLSAGEVTALPSLLATVDALIDDASPEEAAALLDRSADGPEPTGVDLSSWDARRQTRVARRLRRVLVTDVAAADTALTAAGLRGL